MTTRLAMSMFVTKEDCMEARIKELEAALSSAQADREALMEVVRVVFTWKLSGVSSAWSAIKAIRAAYEALPAHLRYEAEGKAAP